METKTRGTIFQTQKTSPLSDKPLEFLAVPFFAALFFLCSADQYFTFHIHGYNFRFGQLLLLICSVLSLRQFSLEAKLEPGYWQECWAAFKNWIPFFLIYGLAALTGENPARSFLKLCWALFNIGGVLLLFLNHRWAHSLQRGIFWGVLAIAATLWLQLIAIYMFGASIPTLPYSVASQALFFQGLPSLPLGFAQNAYSSIDGVPIFRPNAFYYEPSYAGCALAFAFPFIFNAVRKVASLKNLLAPVLILGAVLFTSSRSGILCVVFILVSMLAAALIGRSKNLFTPLVKTFLVTVLLMGLTLFAPSVRKYIDFVKGSLRPSGIATRAEDPRLSEGGRVANVLTGLHLWAEHPLLGNGVQEPTNKNNAGLAFVWNSMWLEVGVESGLLGLLAFAFALFKTIWDSAKNNWRSENMIPALCALAAHFVVNMNFSSTFPRLDYWLLFFLYTRHLLQKKVS